MKIPIRYNKNFENFNRDVLPLYGKNIFHNYKKFEGVEDFCLKNFEYVDDTESLIIFPHLLNFEIHDSTFLLLNKFNGSVYGFSNDIVDCDYFYKDHITLYRTALLKSRQKINEYSFPAFCEDVFENTYVNTISIGYCGHLLFGRKKYIDLLNNSKYNTNFIIRDKVLTGIKDYNLKKEFYNNVKDNLFTFCYRGAGNYCYRFYETLMMGRIPLLVNTDRSFIFENDLNLEDVALILNGNENIKEVDFKIEKFVSENNIIEIQKNNRELWLTYCSPIGFLKQFIKNI